MDRRLDEGTRHNRKPKRRRWERVNRQDARVAREPETQINAIASAVIKAAVEVHRILGPGFLEAVDEQALGFELALRGIPFARQPAVPIVYKGHVVGTLALTSWWPSAWSSS